MRWSEVAGGSCHLVKTPSSAMETFSGVYSDRELNYSPGTLGLVVVVQASSLVMMIRSTFSSVHQL